MTHQDVMAAVLSHNRPHLAWKTVGKLRDDESLDRDRILLIVNGGTSYCAKFREVCTVVKLETNVGPAGGFAAALDLSLEYSDWDWLYLCEDDVGSLPLRPSRSRDLGSLLEGVPTGVNVGGIAAYGRCLDRTTGLTTPHIPTVAYGLQEVDVAAWGATFVSRSLVEASVRPDPKWFFAYEDFDFWLQARNAGFALFVDADCERQIGNLASGSAKARHYVGLRKDDSNDAWRRYYEARNFVLLARKHGSRRWLLKHLERSIARAYASGPTAFGAIARGLRDGYLGRAGFNPRFQRSFEWPRT